MITRRALNRATLARQWLLERVDATPLEAIEHLVGLQAQTPHTWYVGLWTRLVNSPAASVADLLERRAVVRMSLMRGTIHLVTVDDALALRPLLQTASERGFKGSFAKHLTGVDLDAVIAAGRRIIDETPCTFAELGRELGKQWPGVDEAALAQVLRAYVPLVQVTPRGVWGKSGRSAHTSLENWVKTPLRVYAVEALVRRYLRAFGPASVMDMQAWAGITRLSEVFERMRPELVTFRDPSGVELFDLPDAPRPDEDIPAPARYLYDFDNLLLSHADRSRVTTPRYGAIAVGYMAANVQPRLVLLDGLPAATWTLKQHRGTATLAVRPFERLRARDRDALTAEGADLLTFHAPKATHDLIFEPPHPP